MITDERIGHLLEIFNADRDVDRETYQDAIYALRELRQLRKAVVDHNIVMSGCCQILPCPPAS